MRHKLNKIKEEEEKRKRKRIMRAVGRTCLELAGLASVVGSMRNPKSLLLRGHLPGRLMTALIVMLPLLATPAFAQIGGKTAADGPFTLDNVEDLDTTAGGVMRAWIPTFVPGQTDPLQAVALSGSGLTLAAGQTPVGALRYRMSTYFGYVNYSFGVPMPAVVGESTLTYPGNITSFRYLRFVSRVSTAIADATFMVLLESYPATAPDVYPTLYWNYALTPGTTFTEVVLDLYNPSHMENTGSLTVAELLSKTRYLAFYYYGGPELLPKTLDAHVDDVQLTGAAAVGDWSLYH
jgi:hypothetical protein